MLSMDEILHPISFAEFKLAAMGREPLHVPASADCTKRDLLTWDAFNALLAQTNIWDSDRLQMMHRETDVPPERYCRSRPSPAGMIWRPDPAMVELMLGAGASILANDMLTLHPPIHQAGAVLGQAMGARVGASVFCSFKGARALGTHYDVHDVFAVQTEGEKVWNFYENRVEDPLDYPPGLTHADVERARGRLMSTVTMRPGDVLYVPRGIYHDAVALDAPSLHVSFTVMPLTGRGLLPLIDIMARDHPALRAWMPSADMEPKAFTLAVQELGDILGEIIASSEFREEAARQQRRAMPRAPSFTLPARKTLTLYRATGRAFPETDAAGRRLQDWMTGQGRFAVEDMMVQFDGEPDDFVQTAVEAGLQAGALERL